MMRTFLCLKPGTVPPGSLTQPSFRDGLSLSVQGMGPGSGSPIHELQKSLQRPSGGPADGATGVRRDQADL